MIRTSERGEWNNPKFTRQVRKNYENRLIAEEGQMRFSAKRRMRAVRLYIERFSTRIPVSERPMKVYLDADSTVFQAPHFLTMR